MESAEICLLASGWVQGGVQASSLISRLQTVAAGFRGVTQGGYKPCTQNGYNRISTPPSRAQGAISRGELSDDGSSSSAHRVAN